MKLILLNNKKKYKRIAMAMGECFFAVSGHNQPCPWVREKCSLTALKHSTLEPLSFSYFAWRIKHFSSQQNINIFINRAWG